MRISAIKTKNNSGLGITTIYYTKRFLLKLIHISKEVLNGSKLGHFPLISYVPGASTKNEKEISRWYYLLYLQENQEDELQRRPQFTFNSTQQRILAVATFPPAPPRNNPHDDLTPKFTDHSHITNVQVVFHDNFFFVKHQKEIYIYTI